jgi:hypothetical protein
MDLKGKCVKVYKEIKRSETGHDAGYSEQNKRRPWCPTGTGDNLAQPSTYNLLWET